MYVPGGCWLVVHCSYSGMKLSPALLLEVGIFLQTFLKRKIEALTVSDAIAAADNTCIMAENLVRSEICQSCITCQIAKI